MGARKLSPRTMKRRNSTAIMANESGMKPTTIQRGMSSELGFVDVFRKLNAKPEQYTWWSNRGQAWAKNVGWRIDYQIATPGVAAMAQQESIYKRKRFSDHAPLTIDYDYPLA